MRKSRRLRPIAGLARNKEDRAAVAVGECARQLHAQERQLAELEDFHQDYLRRFHEVGRSGADVQRLNEYRRFIEQLGQAVARQRRLVDEARRRLEAAGRRWSEVRSRRRVLDKVIDRLQAHEYRETERRLQREADDRPPGVRSPLDGED